MSKKVKRKGISKSQVNLKKYQREEINRSQRRNEKQKTKKELDCEKV